MLDAEARHAMTIRFVAMRAPELFDSISLAIDLYFRLQRRTLWEIAASLETNLATSKEQLEAIVASMEVEEGGQQAWRRLIGPLRSPLSTCLHLGRPLLEGLEECGRPKPLGRQLPVVNEVVADLSVEDSLSSD